MLGTVNRQHVNPGHWSIWSRQWCHSILSFFFDSLKSGYGPISENEIDSKSFNSQVIEALVCLNLLAGNLIC